MPRRAKDIELETSDIATWANKERPPGLRLPRFFLVVLMWCRFRWFFFVLWKGNPQAKNVVPVKLKYKENGAGPFRTHGHWRFGHIMCIYIIHIYLNPQTTHKNWISPHNFG